MFCINCGREIRDNSKFCSGCGIPINQIKVDISEPQYIKTHPQIETAKEKRIQAKSLENMYDKTQDTKRKMLPIIIVVGAVFAIAIVIVVLWVNYGKNIDVDTSNQDTSSLSVSSDDEIELASDVTDEDDLMEDTKEDIEADTEKGFRIQPYQGYIDIEAEIEEIREWYYYPTSSETVKEITDSGSDYTRQYCYHNGQLYFVFIYKNGEEHRFYLKNEKLIRYISPHKTQYDQDISGIPEHLLNLIYIEGIISIESEDFIFPDSDKRLLTDADLAPIANDKVKLEIARNEMYARYGYKFSKNQVMIDYFSNMSWYEPTTTDQGEIYHSFSQIEKDNIEKIKSYEERIK